MTPKHAPATPLPWRSVSSYYPETGKEEDFSPYIVGADKSNVAAAMMQPRERDFLRNRGYLTHAANAYPQLVKALRRTMQCAEHSTIEWIDADKLLRSLGEL